MKLLTASQMQQWDAFTISHQPIASIDLMEKAAQACTYHISIFTDREVPIRIFCAKGNNGGDGLAIARQLLEKKYKIAVYILEFGVRGTEDFQTNLQRLFPLTEALHFLRSEEDFPAIEQDDIIIDALWGSGLNRPLEGIAARLVQYINDADVRVISIDVPSGMFIDGSSAGNTIIQATHTLTFQQEKFCFMLAENAIYAGDIQVMDIGLKESFLKTIETTYHLITQTELFSIYEPRTAFAHKGTYGHALLVAGSYGKMGAAVLAARACLRSGVGLLTTLIPAAGFVVMQTAVPEAMALDNIEQATGTYSCIGVGPGMGTDDAAVALLKELLLRASQPMVIDADALNIISQHPDLVELIPENSILTPHPKEFDRLFGSHANEADRLAKALEISTQHPWVVLVKGHHTLVAWQGKGWFNTTGNPGMATGGSGDVLTGIITSLMTQYKDPFQATLLAVYLHGLAADLALEEQTISMESLLPSDIINTLGSAFYAIS